MIRKHPDKVFQGGYSDIRLWPCYMIISSLMLYLIPQIGAFWSTILVFTPAILIAKWVADMQPKEIFEYEAWKKDLDFAIDNGTSIPELDNYRHIEVKKPRIKTEKRKQPKLIGTLPATARSL